MFVDHSKLFLYPNQPYQAAPEKLKELVLYKTFKDDISERLS